MTLRQYRMAQEAQQDIRAAWGRFFGAYDVVIVPSHCTAAFVKDESDREGRTLDLGKGADDGGCVLPQRLSFTLTLVRLEHPRLLLRLHSHHHHHHHHQSSMGRSGPCPTGKPSSGRCLPTLACYPPRTCNTGVATRVSSPIVGHPSLLSLTPPTHPSVLFPIAAVLWYMCAGEIIKTSRYTVGSSRDGSHLFHVNLTTHDWSCFCHIEHQQEL